MRAALFYTIDSRKISCILIRGCTSRTRCIERKIRMQRQISIPATLTAHRIIRTFTCNQSGHFGYRSINLDEFYQEVWTDPDEVLDHDRVVSHLRAMLQSSEMKHHYILGYQVMEIEELVEDRSAWLFENATTKRDVKTLGAKVFVCAEPYMKIMSMEELAENALWVRRQKSRGLIHSITADARFVNEFVPGEYEKLSSLPTETQILKLNRMVYVPLKPGVTEYRSVPDLNPPL